MAQRSETFISLGDGQGGRLNIGVRYNDQNMRVSGVEASNTSTLTAFIEVVYTNNGVMERFEIPPGFAGTRGFNRNLSMVEEFDPESGETTPVLSGIQQWNAGFVIPV